MNPSSITRAFGKAKFVQIGFDGDWEHCLSIPLAGTPSDHGLSRHGLSRHDIETIRDYRSNDIAFEVFYEHPNGESFIGIRPRIDHYDPKVIEKLTLSLVQESDLNVTRAAQLFQRHFALEAPLFTTQPAHLEMGVVNLWNSFGQIVLWRGLADAYNLDHLATNDAARYLQAQPMPIGLEVAFANPHHWLAVPVSKPTNDGRHLLDLPVLAQAMRAILTEGADG
jgi:hypothetical protein